MKIKFAGYTEKELIKELESLSDIVERAGELEDNIFSACLSFLRDKSATIALLTKDLENFIKVLKKGVGMFYPEFMEDYEIMKTELNAAYDDIEELREEISCLKAKPGSFVPERKD